MGNTMTSKTYLVHKTDAEGAITINERGIITTSLDDRPDWADGLAIAHLAEHATYYKARTGDNYQIPQIINFDDLGWSGVDETDELTMTEPNMEFRQERLGLLLGIDLSDVEAFDNMSKDTLASAEIAMDVHRSSEELAAFEESQKHGFGPLKTATA